MSLPTPSPTSLSGPRPVRRALLAHLCWEGVLLVALLVAVLLAIASPGPLPIRFYWPQLAILGLTAAGLALSLRTATPNLMVGPAGLLAAYLFAQLLVHGSSVPLAAIVAVAVTTAYGVVVALLDAVLGAPSWVLTLGAGLVVQVVFYSQSGQTGEPLRLPGGATASNTFPVLWTLVFLVGSIGGGVLWMFGGGLTRRLGARRDATGPSPLSLDQVLGSLLGIGGSTLLYAISGVLVAQQVRAVSGAGSDRLSLALAVVLLGGVSASGRRGGIAGTALATVLLVVVTITATVRGADFWIAGLLVPGVAIVVGLVVGRVLEHLGGPDVELEPTTGPVVVQVG